MSKGAADDPPALGRRPRRKCPGDVALGNPPVRAIERVEREAEPRAAALHDRKRQRADDCDQPAHQEVLEAVPHAPLSSALCLAPFFVESEWAIRDHIHSRNWPAGSIATA